MQIKNEPGCGGLKTEEVVEGLHKKRWASKTQIPLFPTSAEGSHFREKEQKALNMKLQV